MKNKLLIYFVGWLVLLCVVIGAYFFWYTIVGAETNQVVAISSQIAAKTQDSLRLAQAKSQLSSLAVEESTIEQYFVSTNDVVPYLTQLETTGRSLGSNVTVESVSATPGTPFGHLSVSLQITGTFNAVLRTVGAIEYEPYDTSVTSLTLDLVPDQGTTASSTPGWVATAVFSVGTDNAPVTPPPSPAITPATTTIATTTATTTP